MTVHLSAYVYAGEDDVDVIPQEKESVVGLTRLVPKTPSVEDNAQSIVDTLNKALGKNYVACQIIMDAERYFIVIAFENEEEPDDQGEEYVVFVTDGEVA